jgi:MoaA/NifB/PqqE/SkfB family radical SAM enzyme
MNLNKDISRKLRPAHWTAWRSYASGTGEYRSIIANEKDHQKIFLDDEASQIWAAIEKGISYQSLESLAQRLGLEGELDSFLAELEGLQLLNSDSTEVQTERASPAPTPKSIEGAENAEPERLFQNWVMDQGFMFHTHWELTYRCNERCVHCYNPGAAHSNAETPRRENKELDTQQVFKSLDRFAEGGVFGLTLTGGEIMLRKDFFEIVEYARSLGMAVNIYTNALKLDDLAIERLASLWVSNVSVSVYSHVPEVHDDITRVKGSFEKAAKALNRLNSLGIKTSLKSVQMAHTLRGYSGVVALAENVGAILEGELGLSPGVDGAIAPMLMSSQNPAELIVAAVTAGFPIYVGDASNNYGEFKRDPKATVCAAGYSGLSVAADGNIYPCNSLPIKSGNLHEHDPLDIWHSALSNRKTITNVQLQNAKSTQGLSDITKNLSQWQDIRLENYQECGTHTRCNWCIKCPGMALMETGSALKPSTTNCRIANARMFAAHLLKSGETKESISAKLGVTANFGALEPSKRVEVEEPNAGRAASTDPRNSVKIFRSDGSEINLDKSKNSGSYRSKKGEQWLINGSSWNVNAMTEFDSLREKFDTLKEATFN